VAIWVTGGLIDAVDHLPLLPFLLKLVGTTYSGWFTYRWGGSLLQAADGQVVCCKGAGGQVVCCKQ
jgi:hypothetical protein